MSGCDDCASSSLDAADPLLRRVLAPPAVAMPAGTAAE